MGNQEKINSVPHCQTCRSERVVLDAWACFNPASGLWELESTFDDAFCHNCEASTKLEWTEQTQPRHLRIRELNDVFRTKGQGRGTILVTQGTQAEGAEFALSAIAAVRGFTDFTEDNDPWGEHDFGAIDVAGQKVFFKLDYFADETLSAGSENPANENLSFRVLTIMLASEY
ncbi:DUF3768 domain-containing protein [Tateyamaria sp. SN3-11]|uniref:DUF3768 domain-containing protein n=1 Tax=Tateyamaria sp. SN3-11 TaxID=3092147 RepID=UPI0039E7872B